MALSFQPVTLDTSLGDSEAMLAFRCGRLLAVLSRLGPIHGQSAGRWYVEVIFADVSGRPSTSFSSLEEVEQWVESDVRRL